MEEPFLILAVAGSLRVGSYNRGLLRAAAETAPEGVELETFDIASVPPYDQDAEQAGPPGAGAAAEGQDRGSAPRTPGREATRRAARE